MKHVLFIAYHFPPLAGGGTFRSLKFVKYLPQFGWLPTVVTTNTRNYWAYDKSLLDEIPKEVKIIRASEFDPFYLQILLSKVGLGKLYQKIKNQFFIPDEKIGWIPIAYRKAVKEIKKQKYDLIFSTSPTPSAHIIALNLKKRFGIPWIADYRDHWTLNPDYQESRKRIQKESGIEKHLHHYASHIILNTYGNKSDIVHTYDIVNPNKISVIPNGYEDFLTDQQPIKSNKMRLIYTGTLYGRRDPFNFLEGLSILKRELPSIPIEIIFIGKSEWDINECANKFNISNMVEYIPFLNINKVNQQIYNSDVLLLLIDTTTQSPHVIPSKLYDYLSFYRPIFAIIHDGDSKNIILKSNLGFFANPYSVENIKNQLLRIYNLWKSNKLHVEPNFNYIRQFHRRNLTQQLAEIFNSHL